MQLIKTSFILFLIIAIYCFIGVVIFGNIIFILIATIELCLSEGCSNVVDLYISLLLKWSSWDYVLMRYFKVLGILYILSFVIMLRERYMDTDN